MGRSGRRGFTMVEMLLVLVILATLAAALVQTGRFALQKRLGSAERTDAVEHAIP